MKNKKLKQISAEEKLIIYGMYTEYIKNIKHFDLLQTYYRLLSSTILLASFLAIGFLFSSQAKSIPIDRTLSVLLITFISSSLMISLWHLDLIFFERLMVSNFAEAFRLELNNEWLPKVHSNISVFNKFHDSPTNVAIYYIGSISSLFLTTGLIIAYSLAQYGVWVICIVILITILCIFFIKIWLKKRTIKLNVLLKNLKLDNLK